MSAQPQMSEKLRARMQKGAAPLLEPDESVLYGVPNLTMPMWVYGAFVGLLVLPYVIQKASMVVVTERNVYVLKTNGFSFKASKVLFKAPLGSVEATVGGSAFPGRYLLVGDQKVWLHFNRKIQNRARAIAAAASGGSAFQAPAAEPPAGESIAEVAEPAAAEPSPAPAPSSPTDQPAEPGQPSGGTPGTEPTPASEPPPGPAA